MPTAQRAAKCLPCQLMRTSRRETETKKQRTISWRCHDSTVTKLGEERKDTKLEHARHKKEEARSKPQGLITNLGVSLGKKRRSKPARRCNAEESETTQQILCCDSCAAPRVIKRKISTRKTRHIELKAFFLQWSARPEVRLVVEMSEMLADCLTKIKSTQNSIHLSRLRTD